MRRRIPIRIRFPMVSVVFPTGECANTVDEPWITGRARLAAGQFGGGLPGGCDLGCRETSAATSTARQGYPPTFHHIDHYEKHRLSGTVAGRMGGSVHKPTAPIIKMTGIKFLNTERGQIGWSVCRPCVGHACHHSL